MNAGCVVPATLTLETPGTCSIAGTIELLAMAPRSPGEYLFETSASETTVGSLGFATRNVGA